MIINILFTLLMLALAIWDLRSFGTKAHKDFKSLIMSIGILGTFAGVFVGLLGFDTHNLLDSVPALLDGLKTAFYTSIVGMAIAIALSIYQKSKTINKEETNELSYIASQSQKLDDLAHLKELPNLTSSLHNIRLEITKKENFEKELKTILKDIHVSLNQTIETLASGASKELIKALEIVISDFNNNLKEQFGENFKQLNEATKNMLDWQSNYKTYIEDNTNSLHAIQKTLQEAQIAMQQASESIQANKDNLIQIQEYNAFNIGLQERLSEALNALNMLGESFEEKLQTLSSLKDSSFEALQNSKEFIEGLQTSKNILHDYLQDYKQKLLVCFEESYKQLNATNTELKTQNLDILERIQESHNDFTNKLQSTHTDVLESFKTVSQNSNELAQTINDDMQTKSNALLSLNTDFKTQADSLLEKLEEASNQSIECAQKVHDKTQKLCDEKFELLDTKISNTTQVLQDTLMQNTQNLQDFTKESMQTLTTTFTEHDQVLQEALQNNHNIIVQNIDNLHTTFQDKITTDYQIMQDKILESSQTTHEFLHESAKEFIQSHTDCINSSIESTKTLVDNHMKNLENMQEKNLENMQENIENTKQFLANSHQESTNALENLHNNALNKIEDISKQTTQNTINNLENLQAAYRENIESDLKSIQQNVQSMNQNLKEEIQTLRNITQETLKNLQENLQTQHVKTTDSIAEILKNSGQYFIQTSEDFTDLLKSQYKKLNTTFDRHSQEVNNFLQTQTENLKNTLEEQNGNLKEILSTQSEHLNKDLITKSDTLHQFLQTQTTCLDTNLQQMLQKFNKMLEHNYMNLTEMLEKDNNLIVKSLDSQAIHLSNSLSQSHKKLDDFLQTTYQKLSNNADSMLEKITHNTVSVSKNLTLTGDEIKDNLHSLMQTLQTTHNQSQKLYEEKLTQSLEGQNRIMNDLQTKSQGFYKDLGENLHNFVQNFNTTSIDIHRSCQNILNDMQELQSNNQSLNDNILKNTQEFNAKFYNTLEQSLNGLTTNLNKHFGKIMQKNTELLENFETKINHFGSTLGDFETNSKTNFENLNTHFKNLCVQYIKLMQASMQANVKTQAKATEQINAAIHSIQTNVNQLTSTSNNLFTTQKDSLDEIVRHFRENTQELAKQGAMLHENLGTNLEELDTKMEKMTQNFANNYEWFLKKIQEIMGVNNS